MASEPARRASSPSARCSSSAWPSPFRSNVSDSLAGRGQRGHPQHPGRHSAASSNHMFDRRSDRQRTPEQQAAINNQLERLVASGRLLRIKVWSPTRQVVYSDLPRCAARSSDRPRTTSRGARRRAGGRVQRRRRRRERVRARPRRPLPVDLPADPSARRPDHAHRRLRDLRGRGADRCRDRRDPPQRAAHRRRLRPRPAARPASSRFAGASRCWPARTSCCDQRERFRSLVQNSTDVNMIVRRDGTIAYESPAVERVLGYRAGCARRPARPSRSVHADDRPWPSICSPMSCARPAARPPTECACATPTARCADVEVVLQQPARRPGRRRRRRQLPRRHRRAKRSRTSCATRRSTTR